MLQLQLVPGLAGAAKQAAAAGHRAWPCRATGPRTRWSRPACRATSPASRSGGRASPKVTWKNRINLTLGYDPTTPNAQDIAIQIRTRLENTGGLSVKLAPGDPGGRPRRWSDRKAWTATGLAWLQPYVDAPLPAVRETMETTIVTTFRKTTDDALGRRLLLGALQKQAAVDLCAAADQPESDEYVFARSGG